MKPADYLIGCLEEATEAYVVLVRVDGSASVHVGKVRADGSAMLAGVETRGLKLGAIIDEMHGPLTWVSAQVHMDGYDDLPVEVRDLIKEHGPRVKRMYDEGYEAEDIKIILKGEGIV